jgi:hypothetical protein
MPKAPKKVKLGKRVLSVIEAAEHGEKLCKSIRQSDVGAEISWSLEPSGKSVGEHTARKIIESGLLVPSADGLFGAETSQTWGAA